MLSAAQDAVQSVLTSTQAFCKFLSANDTGATGGHQCGILISKHAAKMIFPAEELSGTLLKRQIRVLWPNDLHTDSNFTYYASKNELRLTAFGRDFPYLQPDQTGALFVLTQQTEDLYSGFFIETEEGIEYFLDAFGLHPAETNRLIRTKNAAPEVLERDAVRRFIQAQTEDFPTSSVMASAAREIHRQVYTNLTPAQNQPDFQLLAWTHLEYRLFRALEHDRYQNILSNGFQTVDAFISIANSVLNRRKSRAGKSLEHHLAALFDSRHIRYASQEVTEGRKTPDFLFPSGADYRNPHFPTEKLATLAAKTTCKDRWRQVLNEADRLRDRPKYLCTLQQGISASQLTEMEAENVVLVVPKPYITAYPPEKRAGIWTLDQFLRYIEELER